MDVSPLLPGRCSGDARIWSLVATHQGRELLGHVGEACSVTPASCGFGPKQLKLGSCRNREWSVDLRVLNAVSIFPAMDSLSSAIERAADSNMAAAWWQLGGSRELAWWQHGIWKQL